MNTCKMKHLLLNNQGTMESWLVDSSSSAWKLQVLECLVRKYQKVMNCSKIVGRNPAQCYVAAWMGGEFGGEQMHVRV